MSSTGRWSAWPHTHWSHQSPNHFCTIGVELVEHKLMTATQRCQKWSNKGQRHGFQTWVAQPRQHTATWAMSAGLVPGAPRPQCGVGRAGDQPLSSFPIPSNYSAVVLCLGGTSRKHLDDQEDQGGLLHGPPESGRGCATYTIIGFQTWVAHIPLSTRFKST